MTSGRRRGPCNRYTPWWRMYWEPCGPAAVGGDHLQRSDGAKGLASPADLLLARPEGL